MTDVYNSISGSNGISGAADTLLALRKERRSDRTATLHVIGRDVEPQELIVEMDENCRWNLVGSADELQSQLAQKRFEATSVVRTVLELLEENPGGVKLSAEELRSETIRRAGYLGEQDNAPRIGRFLADNTHSFAEIGILYEFKRQREKRLHCFRMEAT